MVEHVDQERSGWPSLFRCYGWQANRPQWSEIAEKLAKYRHMP
jgi:hypothetical protein